MNVFSKNGLGARERERERATSTFDCEFGIRLRFRFDDVKSAGGNKLSFWRKKRDLLATSGPTCFLHGRGFACLGFPTPRFYIFFPATDKLFQQVYISTNAIKETERITLNYEKLI